MHVNTNLAFNVNYKIAVRCTAPNYIDSFIKSSDEINNNFAACAQSVHHQHAYMISDCITTGQLQPR